jgi:hypothetical protein
MQSAMYLGYSLTVEAGTISLIIGKPKFVTLAYEIYLSQIPLVRYEGMHESNLNCISQGFY